MVKHLYLLLLSLSLIACDPGRINIDGAQVTPTPTPTPTPTQPDRKNITYLSMHAERDLYALCSESPNIRLISARYVISFTCYPTQREVALVYLQVCERHYTQIVSDNATTETNKCYTYGGNVFSVINYYTEKNGPGLQIQFDDTNYGVSLGIYYYTAPLKNFSFFVSKQSVIILDQTPYVITDRNFTVESMQ